MREAELSTLLELRLLVGYLGEKEQYGWWASSFFSPIAASFLEPVFVRTSKLAQYNGVLEAGRRAHDASVGVGSAFHLFRLPQQFEQDLHRLAGERLNERHPAIAAMESKGSAMARVDALAGDAPREGEGPVNVGSIGDLQKASVVKRLAAHYRRAFASGTRVYPYGLEDP
ncbi:MAG: BrxE family protein [Thermoanaerobaculia bacterium]